MENGEEWWFVFNFYRKLLRGFRVTKIVVEIYRKFLFIFLRILK